MADELIQIDQRKDEAPRLLSALLLARALIAVLRCG
jgi:hypothetical protein